jgi:hypothetical protein
MPARGHGQKSGVASMAAVPKIRSAEKQAAPRAGRKAESRRQNGRSGRARGGATGSTNSKAIVANRMLPFMRDFLA